ncbi:MAG: hypothetical protein FWF18_05770, partial [Dehalococcoidia bacterium]|nr:hypothetical protein [Dehalococcoidia bacterium]
SSDIISYRQGGVGDSYQTKVKKGNTYVLVLIYSNSLDQYMATSFEDSVFMVDGKNKLMSLSAQPCCARYDGIDLSILIEDVRQDRIDNAVWYEWYQDIRKTWD